jgi:hypothetical protein
LQSVDDRAVRSQREPLQAQRGPQKVAEEAFECRAIGRLYDDAGMDVDPLRDGAERRIRAARSRRLVAGERQGGLLRALVSDTA